MYQLTTKPAFFNIKRKGGNFRYYNHGGEYHWTIQMILNNSIVQSVKYIKSLKKTPIFIDAWNAEAIHSQSKKTSPIDNRDFFYYNEIVKLSTISKHN